jgi:uncharacterized repeat protein (TIGR01451 family)
MKNSKKFLMAVLAVIFVFGLSKSSSVFAATSPTLTGAVSYSVLGASTVTNTGSTTIGGDLGVSPGTAITGFPPGVVGGVTHSNDASAISAQTDDVNAFGTLDQPCDHSYADGQDLTLLSPLPPGVYCSAGSFALSGNLTLSGSGVWIFKSASTLVTASNSTVTGGDPCNVWWRVGSSATLGTNSSLMGNIFALASITFDTGASLNGRALAQTGAVTLDTNTISGPVCSVPPPPPPPTTAHLTLIKTVTNDNGGSALASAWILAAAGPTPISGVTGSGTVTNAVVSTGAYTLSESGGPVGYTSGTYSCIKNGGAAVVGNSITLASGDTAICTITNTDIAPSLTLNKVVVGGAALPTAWTLTATGTGGSPTNLTGTNPVVSGATFKADTYTLTESGGPSGYTPSTYSCIKNGGTAVVGNSITLASGDTAICTITNTDIAPQLTVTKIVVGGTKVVSDFPLFIDGNGVVSGIVNTTSIGLHTISETSSPNYTSVIAGDCAPNGTITLAPGDIKICTITNTYVAPASSGGGGGGGGYTVPVPPLIDVVKVPDPLALPAGPGLVTYTYTLRNIGTVPVSNITMVDNNCSPVKYVSGDTNGDSKLDTTETWTYTCFTTLTKTTMNTVVATGWANGISATSIANATVVVGASVVPPLIHVTKIPSPLALLAGSGKVTYTEKITNPGTVALSNVKISDNECSPMKYVSGDTNSDSKLDPTETWTYTCSTNLTKTTTNTATVSGEANGLTATDFAIATVVVSTPGLPKTGFPPEENTSWIILLFSALILSSISIIVFLKKHTI